MSSTNRSNSRKSHISDYYVTPIYVVEDLLAALPNEVKYNLMLYCDCVLDPCAGGNPETDSLFCTDRPYTKVLHKYRSGVYANDIRVDANCMLTCDFLSPSDRHHIELTMGGLPGVIISNPPFNKAMEFIKAGLDFVKDDGYVIYLLRLNFFGNQSRKEFLHNNMPQYTLVHTQRINFMTNQKDKKKQGTDSIEYAHFIWRKGYHPEYTKLKVI